MRRLLAALATTLLLLAGCSEHGTYVVVHIVRTADTPQDIRTIELRLTLGTRTDSTVLSHKDLSLIPLPASKTLEIITGSGRLGIVAIGSSLSGDSRGETSVEVVRGETVEVEVMLGAVASADAGLDGGPHDGAAADAGPPDAGPPDDAQPDAALGVTLVPDRLDVDFGTLNPGSPPAAYHYRVTNTGTQPAGAITASLTGPNAAEFQAGDCVPATTLSPNSSCTGTIQFAPRTTASLGSQRATLVLHGTVADTSVALSGSVGLGEDDFLSSRPLRYGTVALGDSKSLDVTFTNGTIGPTSQAGNTLTGSDANAFAVTGTTCAGMLAPGGTCVVHLRFSPLHTGDVAASLVLMVGGVGVVATALEGRGGLAIHVNLGGNGQGNVQSVPVALDCPGTCDAVFDPGRVVLTPTPSTSSVFLGWTGACSGTGPCTLDLTEAQPNTVVTATFQAAFNLLVNVVGTGSGRVSSLPAGIDCSSPSCVAHFAGNVTLTARPSLGSRFAGWAGGCTGGRRTCVLDLSVDRTVMAQFVPLRGNLIFASSASYGANLIGTAAYDAQCNQLAAAVGLNNASNDAYIAWMSDASTTARSRLGSARGFIRVDGQLFADDLVGLLDQDRVLSPVALDENGAPATGLVWTGTDSHGAAGVTCGNWTTLAGQGTVGDTASGPIGWTQASAQSCGAPSRIYCVMKTSLTMLPMPLISGKRIFLANGLWSSGAGRASADSFCDASKPAGVASALALLPVVGGTASERLSLGSLYVRPDGMLVGSGQAIAGGTLVNGIWQWGDGSYLSGTARTATATPTAVAVASETCGDWTLATGFSRIGAFSNLTSFWSITDDPCGQAEHIYCVEP